MAETTINSLDTKTGMDLRWIRPPVQDRSQRTLERLLDATEKLLEKRPFEEISVQQIVSAARSSVGSFYARFPTKYALFQALHERYVQESLLTTSEALDPRRWAGVPLAVVTGNACAFLVVSLRERRGIRRAIVAQHAVDREARLRSAGLAEHVVGALARLLASRRDELGDLLPYPAARFVHRIVFAVLDQALVFGNDSPEGGTPLSEEQLIAELTRACLAYLTLKDAGH